MSARSTIFAAVTRARRGTPPNAGEAHALHNILDAIGVPIEPPQPEPTQWR